MRTVIALFFLLVFSLQALPVKTMGKLLGKKQQSEEVKDGCDDTTDDDCDDDSKDGKGLNYNDLICHHTTAFDIDFSFSKSVAPASHLDDDLPNSHTRDILSPPPDC